MYIATRVVFVTLVLILSGCGRLSSMLDEVVPDQRKDYTKARTLPDLSIPPGLTTGAIRDKMSIPEESPEGERSYSDFQDRASQREGGNLASPSSPESRRVTQGIVVTEVSTLDDQHIIVVESGRYDLWEKIKYFWSNEGFGFQLDDPELGVLETEWIEDRNGLTRNRYKIFAENGKDEGTTIVFLSHQKQDLVQVEQAYGEDYEWGEVGRDKKIEASTVDRLRSSLETQVNQATYASTEPLLSEDSLVSSEDAYDPSRDFANKMSPRKLRPAGEARSSRPEPTQRDPVDASSRRSPEANAETSTYSASEDFAKKMNPRKTNRPSAAVSQSEPKDAYSTADEFSSVRMVSVGRGKYYLTLESDFNNAWKSTKQALRVANVSVRKADKGRGVFVVDLIETGYGESPGWGRLKFWKTNETSQYQVSVTGIGDKTEVVILDPDGRWITSHEAERLLDRIYNALVSDVR